MHTWGAIVNSHRIFTGCTPSLAAAVGATAFAMVRARSLATIALGTWARTLACGAFVTNRYLQTPKHIKKTRPGSNRHGSWMPRAKIIIFTDSQTMNPVPICIIEG